MSALTRPAAVWRCRQSGVSTNGGSFDSTISGAGTDYSDQDAAQLTGSAGTCTAGGATFIDATATFTSAMVGNAIRIRSGTNFVDGYYHVTGYTSATTVTLDRDPTNGSNATVGVWSLGGAINFAQVKSILSGSTAGLRCIPGNTVMIRGSGTDTPTSNDYTTTGQIAFSIGGDSTNGALAIVGYNGRPRIQGDGLIFNGNNFGNQRLENLYLIVTAANTGGTVITQWQGGAIKNVVVNLNNVSNLVGIDNIGGSAVVGCEVHNGTSSPTATGQVGIRSGSNNLPMIIGNYIHHIGGIGIQRTGPDSMMLVQRNIVYACTGNGIELNTSSNHARPSVVSDNTVHANLGNGIQLTNAGEPGANLVFNNIITGHVGAGKYGLSCGGTAAQNDGIKRFVDYNNFYNNTSDRNNISAGANDTALDPQFTAPTTGDFTIGTNLRAKGYPSQFLNAAGSISYQDIGAVQRQEPTGGGGPVGGGLLIGMGVVRGATF